MDLEGCDSVHCTIATTFILQGLSEDALLVEFTGRTDVYHNIAADSAARKA